MRRPWSVAVIVLVVPLLSPSPVAAAQCTQALAQQMYEEASAIEKTSGRCRTLSLSDKVDIAQYCSACAGTIQRLLALEQLVRENQSCFTVRRQKREIRRLMSRREQFEFLARGCSS